MSNDYDIARIYKDMEQEIISSMQRNLSRHMQEEKAMGFDYPQWQAEKLRSLRQYQIENAKIINSYTDGLPTEVKAILQNELKQGSLREIVRFKDALAAGYKSATVMNESFFRINARKVNALINTINHDLKKANQACLRYADDAYRKVILKSEMYVANGVFTEKKAIEKAIEDFEKQGLHCIEYANGSYHDIADYADMAIKTASQRAQLMGEGEMRKKLGETLIKISKHGGTCPLCAKWEGKILIDDVYSGGTAEDGPYPLLSEAMAAGLYHPRCRHGCNTYYPEIEDIWEDKNNSELEKINDMNVSELGEYIKSLNDEKEKYFINNAYDIYGDTIEEMENGFFEELETDNSLTDERKYIESINTKLDEANSRLNAIQANNGLQNSYVKINGVNCTKTSKLHGFSDGTSGGVKKTIDADVYITPDGTEFVFPKKYNLSHQTMTPELAISTWNKVPDEIKNKAQKIIEFVDYYNPQDSYWKKQYRNFTHSYAIGGDKITFFRYDHPHDQDYLLRTYSHEAAHFVDKNTATTMSKFSLETEWTNAMKDDKIISNKKSCTFYGENSNIEDFAESVSCFVDDRKSFEKDFPNRAKIITRIFGF